MKHILTAFFTLVPALYLFSVEGNLNPATNDLPKIVTPHEAQKNPLDEINYLIEKTTQSLTNQMALRDMIQHYQQLQNRYLSKSHDNRLLLELVNYAHEVSKKIKELHLEHNFHSEFMSELDLFSQTAIKRKGPRP